MDVFSNIIGTIGVVSGLASYFLVQNNRISATGFTCLGMNLLGAVLIMISLLFHWNFPSFVLEAIWASISIYGLYKHVYLKQK